VERASTFRLSTAAGTDLRGSVQGRPGRVLHGLAREDGAYMAPPDIEAGTAPVERSSEGTVVVDADLLFMGQGPLPSPVLLRFATANSSRRRRRAAGPRDARALRRRPDGQPG
jgi:leucyl aminopeptidase (aminopeptidase T)